MKNSCNICARSERDTLYEGIVKCRKCGHVYCDADLSGEELKKIYSEGYFRGGEYSDYVADKEVAQENFKARLKVLRRFTDPARHKNLLEIGCAYGFFLEVARPYFGQVKGIDITEDGIRYANDKLGPVAVSGDLLTYDFRGEKFDVICMWDTIEHLSNPSAYLEKISGSLINKGGLIAITTGDVDSLNARLRKSKWRLMHSPSHLHFFSRSRLTKLLEQKGFEVLHNGYCGFYRSMDMALHRMFSTTAFGKKCYDILHKSGLTRIRFYSNLYDIMYVIARKK